MSRTCKFHGDELATSPGFHDCTKPGQWGCSCRQLLDEEHAECFAPLPAEEPAHESTPVTFSAILAHHRRLAEDPRADRAWHGEAVECLVGMVGQGEAFASGCDNCDWKPYNGPKCQSWCWVWRARKAVEGEG